MRKGHLWLHLAKAEAMNKSWVSIPTKDLRLLLETVDTLEKSVAQPLAEEKEPLELCNCWNWDCREKLPKGIVDIRNTLDYHLSTRTYVMGPGCNELPHAGHVIGGHDGYTFYRMDDYAD